MCDDCLKWSEKEYKNLSIKVFHLKKDQLIQLFKKVKINWLGADEKIAEKILKEKEDSIEIGTLLEEADSKANLLKWIKHYEKQNKS